MNKKIDFFIIIHKGPQILKYMFTYNQYPALPAGVLGITVKSLLINNYFKCVSSRESVLVISAAECGTFLFSHFLSIIVTRVKGTQNHLCKSSAQLFAERQWLFCL